MDIAVRKWEKIFFVAISFVFFGLIVWKATHMGITYDEAYSFLHHARSSLSDIFLYKGDLPANNHLFNTLSIKFFTGILGVSELVIRIGSLIGALLYIYGAYRLTAYIGRKKTIIRYMAPVVFFAHPYVYDFFVVARGYSLAMGFMMIGFSFFLRALHEKHTRKDLYIFLSLFGCMTLANLSFLNVYLGSVVVYILFALYTQGYRFPSQEIWRRYGIITIATFILGALCVIPIKAMQAENDLRFGGTDSLFSDTYFSLIQSYAYENISTIFHGFLIIISLLIVLIAIWYMVQFFVAKKQKCISLVGVLFLFVFISLSIELQYVLLGTPYVVARTAIYFFPLGGLLLLLIIERLPKKLYPLYLIGGALIIYHFTVSINFTYIPLWRADMHTKIVMQELQQMANSDHVRLSLGIDRFNEPAVEFYEQKEHMENVHHFIISNTNQTGDIYYVYDETYEKYRIDQGKLHIKVLEYYPDAKMVLFTLN